MEKLISVIIPVFRVEKYIGKCVESVCRQSYENLEIILVDDGSDDACPAICDTLAETDDRIRVIHKKNGGLSDARNAGIEAAKGEYLVFIDGDDYVAECMIEGLHNMLIQAGADLAVCGFSYVEEPREEENSKVFDGLETKGLQVLNREEAMLELFGENSLRTIVAWNKLYHRSLFQNIRYPVGKCHEDEFVIHHLLQTTEKIAYTDAKWYAYVQRKSSIMGESYSLKRLDGLEARKLRFLDFEKEGKTVFAKEAYIQYLWSLQDHLVKLSRYFPEEKELRAEIVSDMKRTLKDYPKYKKCLGVKKRLYYRYLLIKGSIS